MEILKIIEQAASTAHKRFVLIGGHALNVHGISRTTGDLDLMVEREDFLFWKEILRDLKYHVFRETAAFLQSKPPTIDAWPIDLMLVTKTTMDKAHQ